MLLSRIVVFYQLDGVVASIISHVVSQMIVILDFYRQV